MKDTNPDHYKVAGADFIKFMHDPQIKGFGDWMFANGYNTGELSINRWIRLVTIAFKDGTRLVTTGETYDGKWKTGISRMLEHTVTHWMPMPELPPEQ